MVTHPAPTIEELARGLDCTPRTILRMKARGVDPANAEQVTAYLASRNKPSVQMIRALQAVSPSQVLSNLLAIREHRNAIKALRAASLQPINADA